MREQADLVPVSAEDVMFTIRMALMKAPGVNWGASRKDPQRAELLMDVAARSIYEHLSQAGIRFSRTPPVTPGPGIYARGGLGGSKE